MSLVHDAMASVTEEAEQIKAEANSAFQAHKYSQAIDLYSRAIELNSQNAVYWANRAFAHTRLEEYGSAIYDASRAIEIDPSYTKGYYRRGAAYLAMGKFKEALKDFQQVKKLRPSDPDATKKLKECEKAVQKLRFMEAIAVDEFGKQSVADSIDFLSIEVEPQYSGARIEGETVTLDFVKKVMEDFKNQKNLHKRYAFQILLQVRQMLKALPSLVDITVMDGKKFTICGDIHGQYYDLLNIFEMNGLPSDENPYLFNGDFVDRGSFSVEVILVLFAFKCLYPNGLYLARGNHESKYMNKIYGFEGEVKSKYNETMVNLFAEVFCCLPLAHVINEKIFVVHGGLFSNDGVKLDDIRKIDRFCEPPEEGSHESNYMNKIYGFEGEVKSKYNETMVNLFAEVFCCLPLAHVINEKIFVVHGGLFSNDGVKLDDIRKIDRFCEPPEEGLMCEILWSDPQPQNGRGPSKRGVGLSFGEDVTKRFLQENDLELVVRSHEVKDEGYEIEHGGKLITVFSAPNYCDQMGNKGAFIKFRAPELKPDIVTFLAVPHPDVRPMAYANNLLRLLS